MINARIIRKQVNQFCCLCHLASQVTEAVKIQAHSPGFVVVFHPGMDVFFLFFPGFGFAVLCFRNGSTSQRCFDQAPCMCVSMHVCACFCVYICVSLCDLVRSVPI